jgi:hypothetical protein
MRPGGRVPIGWLGLVSGRPFAAPLRAGDQQASVSQQGWSGAGVTQAGRVVIAAAICSSAPERMRGSDVGECCQVN